MKEVNIKIKKDTLKVLKKLKEKSYIADVSDDTIIYVALRNELKKLKKLNNLLYEDFLRKMS